MKVIIDRFEGDRAVLELPNGRTVSAPGILFDSAREGDVFNIEKDARETHERKKMISKLSEELFEDKK